MIGLKFAARAQHATQRIDARGQMIERRARLDLALRGPAPRPFDIPWIVLDASKAGRIWGWKPRIPVQSVLEEIAAHAGTHPDWLELSAPLG